MSNDQQEKRGSKRWPAAAILTGLLGVAFLIVLFSPMELERKAQTGDFFAGFAVAAEFIWLVAGYLQQNRELSVQRKELRLQRRSIELQRDEMVKMSKSAVLSEIAKMIDRAHERVAALKLYNGENPSKIVSASMSMMPRVLQVMEGESNSDEKLQASNS